MAKMEIHNPRRILAVSLADSAQHLSDVIKDLTGTHPTPQPSTSEEPSADVDDSHDTLAGITHPLHLTTPYYTASVPIWLDLISSPAEWSASFLSDEAKEVLDVLGGVVVVFRLPSPSASSSAPASSSGSTTSASALSSPYEGGKGDDEVKQLLTHVGKVVRDGLGGWEWEGVALAVGIGGDGGSSGDDPQLDEWEDLCAQSGLEFVHVPKLGGGSAGKEGRNEFGERMGMARVLEALEANDWSGGGMGAGGDEEEEGDDENQLGGKGKGLLDEEEDEFDPERLGFGFDREDFVGLRQAIWAGSGGGNDGEDEEVGEEDVQKLERIMAKLQAVRDASAGLPEEQRKRMAARAVGEVMKEL